MCSTLENHLSLGIPSEANTALHTDAARKSRVAPVTTTVGRHKTENYMPSLETLERFIARIEQNAHAEAIEEFYASNASMQENQSAPRVGRDFLVANERKTLARTKSVQSQCARPIFQNGNHVVIRWIFDVEWKDNSKTHIEELAYQRWEGELLAEEQFFYDPAQFVPRKPAE